MAPRQGVTGRPAIGPVAGGGTAGARATGRLLRIALVGRGIPMSLRTLIGSAPGFGAPVSFDRPQLVRGFTGSAVVVVGDEPGKAVSAVVDGCPGGPPIVVLTDVLDEATAIDALRRGATSYLVTSECSREEFLLALVGTANGASSISPSITTALVRRFHAQQPRCAADDREDLLTERDEAILALLSEGCSNVQIAERLCLAEKTVRNYISRLYSKLEVASRAEAIVWWLNRSSI
ncbi:MAG TPA: response regulator transcription factor [Pseudonocardia sp.]|nr:response regulator transcription factor [Pseudonocardia sp.]